MTPTYRLTLICFLFSLILNSSAYSQISEKEQLRDSYFGTYTMAKVEKKKGRAILHVWGPYIHYSRALPPLALDVMLAGVETMQVEYDEIWKSEDDGMFTPAERKKWKGQLDRNTLYWKNNRIQACTLEKFYSEDPSTGEKLATPSYKVVNIYDRAYILDELPIKYK